MAKHIDEMIGAVQRSQTTLAEQASALSRSEAEARAANAAKSSFLSNVSHELRTPLNVILGHAQVLLRDKRAIPEHARSMSRILSSGSHLLELIDDLLGITRLEASAIELRPAAFSPDALIDDVVRMLSSRAQKKGLELRVERAGTLPTAIQADRRRLLQVLLNLTGNEAGIEAPATLPSHLDTALLLGVGKLDSREIYLLDIDRVLADLQHAT